MNDVVEMRTDVVCGRCGKKTEITVAADKLSELLEANKKRRETVGAIQKLADQIPVDSGPEIIIFTKDNGTYDVEVLDNLCVNTEHKRNRGCSARVKDLIEEVIKLEPRTRKPKNKNTTKKQPPPDPKE